MFYMSNASSSYNLNLSKLPRKHTCPREFSKKFQLITEITTVPLKFEIII